MRVPTVRVAAPATDENPHGFIVINADDLADHHQVVGDDAKPEPKLRPVTRRKGQKQWP